MKKIFTMLLSICSVLFLSQFNVNAQGEDCASATIIGGLPYTATFNTAFFKDDYNAYCNAPFDEDGGFDAVFLYNATATQFVNISTCSATGVTDFDTKLYIYQGTCPAVSSGGPGAGTEVACNDDACSGPSYANPWLARISNFQFVSGQSYFIVVDGWDAASNGMVTLEITPAASVNDLAASFGSYGSGYSCLPYSQVVPNDSAFATLTNNGNTSFTNVNLQLDVLCNNLEDNDTVSVLVSQTTTNVGTVNVNESVTVNAGSYNMMTDSAGLYTYCFSHNQTTDDTSTNDTIYDFVLVNDSVWCNDLWQLGAGASFFNIFGATATTELAALYIPEEKDTLTSVTVTLAVDVTEIGQQLSVCVYNTLDSAAPAIATSSVISADTGVFFYTFKFPGGLCLQKDSLYLISIKNGTVAVGATTILTSAFSSWGKTDAADTWGFFSGIDWMIWANLGTVSTPACPSPLTSTTNVTLYEAVLNWSQTPGALGYEISGGSAGSNPNNYVKIEINNPSTTSYQVFDLVKNTSYEWRIRAACDFDAVNNVPIWGPYSELTFFTTLNCGVVTPISSGPVLPNAARLNWTPHPAAIGYQILGQQSNPPAGGVVKLNVPGGGVSFFDATGLKPNTTYSWGLFAICDLSPYTTGPFSGIDQFTTPTSKTDGIIAGDATLTVSPNPAQDMFRVTLGGEIDMENIKIRVTDLSGKTIKMENSIENNSIIFSSKDLSSGVYQIVVNTNNRTLTDKIIIQK
ncbi:MAG: T9SS type A sorting domain-containing protein [Chitinophagales bacterium]|nr:T9SS type A sorting domain-containing protein [Chitinophagales bacterium]